MEDKASMLEYKVSKKDYGVHIIRVLDQASPGLAAVGNVSVALAELRAEDDTRGPVKELNLEIEAVKRKLELFS